MSRTSPFLGLPLFFRGSFFPGLLYRLLISLDGRRIPCDVSYEPVGKVCFYEGVVDLPAEVIAGEFREGAGEGRFGGYVAFSHEAADHAEIRHGVEHVDEHPGRGKIVDRLGDKGPCDGLSVFRSSPHPVIEGRGDVLLYFDDFQTHDEVLLNLRERVTEAFFQMGEQIVLHPRFQP